MGGGAEAEVGRAVRHAELGEGVIVGVEPSGFVRVFFRGAGERQVAPNRLEPALSWEEQVVRSMQPATPEKLRQLELAIEAEALPLLDGASRLTSAEIDLLPHQVVLVHQVAQARPRRFLIADEVGLGKTIETALVLRELASRGELNRALMVVPAGLVENWRRELNEVFRLDFEVFGSEGDVTDRRTNAFARHDRLIASIDTLKRPARVRRLKEAPPWDLVVFDEAHHLSAYQEGRRVRKTANYKLGETLRDHCRDLLLLSATPHQGDHFRFWMLVRLLRPELFRDERDMIAERHRLGSVVFRRTKADACTPDGRPLFARRAVHTAAFRLDEREETFYLALQDYLRDGYDLAAKEGGKARALGFVMAVFQKIAASSFAAVRQTLERRALALALREALACDAMLDVDGRERAYAEATSLLKKAHGWSDDPIGEAQTQAALAEARLALLKEHASEEVGALEDEGAAVASEAAALGIAVALPEERRRIAFLLELFPDRLETKTEALLDALGQLWSSTPEEKIVIFATYLATVDLVSEAIEARYPGKGVEVLRGGDHGAKTAAQRRFRDPDGPQVLVCTAAGREGINLQFARVLFNYDLPWNPMDLEQRIGRIHRYGQEHTAQVYNLVAANTIEGRIYLLLQEKLERIVGTLGKTKADGRVAEDLEAQILGQLSERLDYNRLYADALADPTLQRTSEELEVALSNATGARKAVSELFQDLDRFDLSDYAAVEDDGEAGGRLLRFTQQAAEVSSGRIREVGPEVWEFEDARTRVRISTSRDVVASSKDVQLLGLDLPLVKEWLDYYRDRGAEGRALRGGIHADDRGVLMTWKVSIESGEGLQHYVVPLGLKHSGERCAALEGITPAHVHRNEEEGIDKRALAALVRESAPPLLHRQLEHEGVLHGGVSYSIRLLGCLDLT